MRMGTRSTPAPGAVKAEPGSPVVDSAEALEGEDVAIAGRVLDGFPDGFYVGGTGAALPDAGADETGLQEPAGAGGAPAMGKEDDRDEGTRKEGDGEGPGEDEEGAVGVDDGEEKEAGEDDEIEKADGGGPAPGAVGGGDTAGVGDHLGLELGLQIGKFAVAERIWAINI